MACLKADVDRRPALHDLLSLGPGPRQPRLRPPDKTAPLADVAFALAALTVEETRELLAGPKCYSLLSGARGAESVDLNPVLAGAEAHSVVSQHCRMSALRATVDGRERQG